jgi:hypothetical protein
MNRKDPESPEVMDPSGSVSRKRKNINFFFGGGGSSFVFRTKSRSTNTYCIRYYIHTVFYRISDTFLTLVYYFTLEKNSDELFSLTKICERYWTRNLKLYKGWFRSQVA